MKFKTPYTTQEVTLNEFVVLSLDGGAYERGALEAVEATTSNIVEAFGRLIEVLERKGALTKPDIYHIVKGYIPKSESEETE
jgi:hypothetical protein